MILGLIAAAALLLVASAEAQPAQQVFRSGAELVRLDLRVFDTNGRPIRDLRADEIELTEDGRRRPILFFQHVEEPAGRYEDVARRTIASEVSTNQGAPRGHLYVLVFDQHHIATGNEQRARIAAERFLRTRVQPGDRVALYALPGPGPQIAFTSNVERAAGELVKIRGSLERLTQGGLGAIRISEAYEIGRGNQEVLNRVVDRLASQQAGTDALGSPGRAGFSTGASGEPRLFEALVKEDARTVATRADESARRLLLMLADVVRELAPIEGRKTLVLFSEGFYTDHVTRELEQVAAAAAQAYAVVYSVDLNRRESDLKEAEPLGSDQHTEIESRLASLGSLAVETDGILLTDAGADPGAALERIADISQDYYLVGFEPVDASKRGEYRRVVARVTRPGARVSTRTGYSLVEGAATPADRRRAIDLAIAAPFAQQGLAIRYTTYVLGAESPGAQRVFVSLAADLPVQRSPARADVVFVVRSARDGRVVASGTDTVAMPTEPSGGGTIGTATYKVQFETPPGEYLMRVVVREPGGLLGSADRRFDVRRLDAAGGVAASDLVLGGAAGSLPVRAVAYAGDALTGLVELYARRPGDLEAVTVTAQLGTASSHADFGDVRTNANGLVSREARIALPLAGIVPGDYVVRVIVREGGDTIAELPREVRILPGSSPPAAVASGTLSPNAAAATVSIAPRDVLGGEIARQYVRALIEASRGSTTQEAAGHAARGAWSAVETALASQPDPGPQLPAVPGQACGSPYYGLRGLARFADGRLDAASDDLRLAAGDPPCALPSFILGWVYATSGARRDAISAWRAAAFADPTMVPAHLAIAEAYVRAAEPALAIQALKAGLRAIPGSPELRERLAALEVR